MPRHHELEVRRLEPSSASSLVHRSGVPATSPAAEHDLAGGDLLEHAPRPFRRSTVNGSPSRRLVVPCDRLLDRRPRRTRVEALEPQVVVEQVRDSPLEASSDASASSRIDERGSDAAGRARLSARGNSTANVPSPRSCRGRGSTPRSGRGRWTARPPTRAGGRRRSSRDAAVGGPAAGPNGRGHARFERARRSRATGSSRQFARTRRRTSGPPSSLDVLAQPRAQSCTTPRGARSSCRRRSPRRAVSAAGPSGSPDDLASSGLAPEEEHRVDLGVLERASPLYGDPGAVAAPAPDGTQSAALSASASTLAREPAHVVRRARRRGCRRRACSRTRARRSGWSWTAHDLYLQLLPRPTAGAGSPAGSSRACRTRGRAGGSCSGRAAEPTGNRFSGSVWVR